MTTPRRFIIAAALIAQSLLPFAGAHADDKKTQSRQKAPKVIELEEIKIEGRVQKPNAFYILNRSNIGYEVMELRTSFVQEIVRAVKTAPF